MFGTNWIEDYIKAGQQDTAKEQLSSFAKHSDHRIRLRVAENHKTPGAILEQLARDAHPDVRSAVAANTATPVDIVFALALDEDATVRHTLAEDPASPLGVLRILANDENAYVKCRAEKTLEALRKYAPKAVRSVRQFAWA